MKKNPGGFLLNQLYECKGEPSIFAEGGEFTIRILTEAEKLNGVDPLPEEWKGIAKVLFPACRYTLGVRWKNLAAKGDPWNRWKDNVSYEMEMWKSKGQWYLPNDAPFEEPGNAINRVECSNMPR